MKRALLALLFVTSPVGAETPMDTFTADNNQTNKITVTWIQANNIQAACNAESKKRGFKGFSKPMEACSFWTTRVTGDNCLIITKKTVNYWTMGHELRHCYQGEYHK